MIIFIDMKRIVLLFLLLLGTVSLYAQRLVEDPDDINVILRAAKNGDSDAQLKYGNYLLSEEGMVDAKKAKEAFQWIMKSAEQGNAEAQFHVSEMYSFGLGVKENNIKSTQWLIRSANNGYAPAQYNLGKKWEEGHIHGSELTFYGECYQAVMYMRRAARQDYAPAQRFLGETYYQISEGKGGKWEGALSESKDNKNNFYTALWWFQQAAANGDDYAAKMASVLGKRYSIDEEKMPSSRITFPYKSPLDYQVEEWCNQYWFLCQDDLPSVMAGFDVPEQILRDDPCLVWLILKDRSTSPQEKNDALRAYDPKEVKAIYERYKKQLAAGYSGRMSSDAHPSTSAARGAINGHEWVDLGLTVKWATTNVGASSPSDYGSYLAWGETKSKNQYTFHTLRYCTDYAGNSFTKYNTESSRGTVDNKKRLELSDDAANQNWGGSWRMPTDEEIMELMNKCDWTWTTQDGKNGYKVTSKSNGNSIFLPAGGSRIDSDLTSAGSRGYYWTSKLGTYNSYEAKYLYLDSSKAQKYESDRSLGFAVRPVTN